MGRTRAAGSGGTVSSSCGSASWTWLSSSGCLNDLFGGCCWSFPSIWRLLVNSTPLVLPAAVVSGWWGRRCWWYWRWSEWAAMCWSETARTARAIRGRLKALQVAAAAAAGDGTADWSVPSNLCSTLWQWVLEWPEAWLELLRWRPPPVPSSSSLGMTAPESWLDFRRRIIDLPPLMSLIPACKAVSDSVSPCWAVLAAAAAATAAETAAVAAAEVSLGRRAAYSTRK